MHSNWIWHNTISDIKEKDDLFKNVAANWVIRCSQMEWFFGNSNDLLFEKDFRVRGSWDHTKVHKKGINPRLVPNWRSFQSRWISGSEWHFCVFQSHILKVRITDLFFCIYLRMPSRIITYLTYFHEWKIIFNSN